MAYVTISPWQDYCRLPWSSYASVSSGARPARGVSSQFSTSRIFGTRIQRTFASRRVTAFEVSRREAKITASADPASVDKMSKSVVSSNGSWLTTSTGAGKIKLEDFRANLMRQEETIIFALIERAQFAQNDIIYSSPSALVPSDFSRSFLDYLLLGTEKLHARMRRYTSPDEAAFFPDELPEPILPALDFVSILRPNRINVCRRIMSAYSGSILHRICTPGDDQQYGASACCDVTVLQAMSKRIHFGKFIAEAKFQEDPEGYARLIRARDEDGLMALLTNLQVEAKLLKRVRYKAWSYGRDISSDSTSSDAPVYDAAGDDPQECKVDPQVVVDVYEKIIIPMTKDVEVLYLLERLDPPAQ